MLQTLKRWLYDFVVWTGILNYIVPFIFCRFNSILINTHNLSNHKEADRSGQKINMNLYNGKRYPPVGVDKISSIPAVRIRSSDVLLCSYPKAGCHWLQEMLHMLVIKKIQMTTLGKEFAGGIDLLPDILLESQPSPRVLNSHLLYEDLPPGIKEKKVKIIFLARNPKDSVVSYFNHHKNMKDSYGYDGSFDDYFELFLEGRLEYGSYFDYILHWDQVLKKTSDNPILLVTYEELKTQPKETLQKVAVFLEVVASDTFLEQIVDACNFGKMKSIRSKQNSVSGSIYRKGVTGDWKNWLTDEQNTAVDTVWQERMSKCIYQPEY